MREIRVGHTPDGDDAFMFYALAKGKVPTDPFQLVHVVEDIETLNQRAMRAELELTAVSLHAYALLADRYVILPCGASAGKGYGPLVVAREPLTLDQLAGKKVAVPGLMTTAFLILQLVERQIEPVVFPFDQILNAVVDGKVAAGVVIHEGQLTYLGYSLRKVVDLGEWWHERTGLPLVLGVNVVRKDVGREAMIQLTEILKSSIVYGLRHRREALQYALPFGRGTDPEMLDRFVSLYVNDYTLDLGMEGRAAVRKVFDWAREEGLLREPVQVEYVQ